MNVSIAIEVQQENKGYRVIGYRNGAIVFTATRVSGTKEKAESRARKVIAKLLRESAKNVGALVLAWPADRQLELVK